MTIIETIATNLTTWMKDHPRLSTIEKVAEESKVGFGTVRRMKNGTSNPTAQNLHEVAKVFGRSAADLMRESTVYDSKPMPAAVIREMPAAETPIDQIVAAARELNRDGQMVLLGEARALARQFRRAKANHAS